MWLFLASVALLLLLSVVLLPIFESSSGFTVPRRILVSTGGLGMFSAGATGLFALVRKGERSWLLFLAVLMAVAIAAFMVNDILGSG
jgi:hypothetical protein